MNQVTNLLNGINIPPITVKIDPDSSNEVMKNAVLWGLFLGTALIGISIVFNKWAK